MTTVLMLYLYVVAGKFFTAGSGLSVAAMAAWGLGYFVVWQERYEKEGRAKLNKFIWLPYVAAFFILGNTLIPTKEQLAWIIGGSVAVSIASTEEAKQLPENVLGAVNSFLKQMHEDEVNE